MKSSVNLSGMFRLFDPTKIGLMRNYPEYLHIQLSKSPGRYTY